MSRTPFVAGEFIFHDKGWTRWRAPLPPKIPGTPRRQNRPCGQVHGDWIVAGMTATRWRGGKTRRRWVANERTYVLSELTKSVRIGAARITVLSTPALSPQ